MRSREYDILRTVEDRHWWYGVLRSLVTDALRKRLPNGAKVLDAGCGTGGMIERLSAFEVHGIDASAAAVKHCLDRGLVRVRVATLHALPFPDECFDAVLSLDVLYHTDVEESRAVSEMRRVLKPGGLLICNLPAFDCLRGAHDVAVCGVRRYEASQVRRRLQGLGVRIERMHYWNVWLFLPLLLWRRWGRGKMKKGDADVTSDLALPPAWLNRVLLLITTLDARACRGWHVPFGSSLFVLARRMELSPAHETK